jgi:hypothetical protein
MVNIYGDRKRKSIPKNYGLQQVSKSNAQRGSNAALANSAADVGYAKAPLQKVIPNPSDRSNPLVALKTEEPRKTDVLHNSSLLIVQDYFNR